MRNFNVLTPGEKIKKIREDFNIRQEELAAGEITRNLISIVENNRGNLTEATANILTQNINNICRERNIDFRITKEYLLESVVSQAKKIADEYIENINNTSVNEMNFIEDTLNEIDVFLKKFNTEEKRAELYMAIGKKFKLNKVYSRAFNYYLKAYESSINNITTTYSLFSLGTCSIYLSKYDEAINYYSILLDLTTEPQLQYYARFNIALCYKKLSKFEDSLNLLNEISEKHKDILEDNSKNYVDVNLLMGNCLYELKAFNKAITTYKNLLKIINGKLKIEELCILSSLADVYKDTKDYSRLEKICSKIKIKISDPSYAQNEYDGDIYISLAKNVRTLNDNKTSEELILKALESYKSGKSFMCLEDVEELITDLLNMYIQEENKEKILYLKNEFFELIQKNIFPKASMIALRFIKYYSLKNNNDEINRMIDYLDA